MASGLIQTAAAATDVNEAHDYTQINTNNTQNGGEDLNRRIDGTKASPPTSSDQNGRKVEITTTQTMLSALSGSLWSSVLVNPMDVVRVRLQAQQSQNTAHTPLKIQSFVNTESTRIGPAIRPGANGTPSPIQYQQVFGRLPSTLGVTACCREVFWMNNQAEFCMATNTMAEPCAIEETARRSFRGTWDGIVKIARYEGLSALWRGLTPTLAMALPANVIYFTGYDALKTHPNSPFSSPEYGNFSPLLAGATARILSCTAISPLELFRTRLWALPHVRSSGGEAEVSAFRKTVQGMKDMVKVEGYTSLWRGLTLTLWRDVPFSALYWLSFETTKAKLKEERQRRRHKITGSNEPVREDHFTIFTDAFISGGLSGGLAAFLTTPFDVGKTKKQIEESKPVVKHNGRQIMDKGFFPSSSPNETLPKFLYTIYKEQGVRGLWKGCVPRMLKVAPACAIMVSNFELFKWWAQQHNERKEAERGAQ